MSGVYKILIDAAQWLMTWSFKFTGNYGVAIILFTFLVQVVTYPLKHPQLRYSKVNQIMAPKLKEIQAKYKGNQQKVTEETMALWKKYKVNPMAGCLPSIIQLPVFFAILAVMRQFQFPAGPQSAFLWIPNIGQVDKLHILPVLSGLSTFFQLQLSGASMEPSQKSMMYMFPLMMAWITWSTPAGLALYWATSNIFGILQQYLVNRYITVPEVVEEAADAKKGAPSKNEKLGKDGQDS
jgi:YidC/Oxa1 family membrane protein insertase